jgi:hypothetical protein
MKNDLFNLINQLTQESKSLWRIKNQYKKDAKGKDQKDFWTKLEKEKEILVKELQDRIAKELK